MVKTLSVEGEDPSSKPPPLPSSDLNQLLTIFITVSQTIG